MRADKYKRDSLNKLAELCLRIANFVDRHAENGSVELSDELGLGYLALSSYLRDGVKAIVDIQDDYSTAIANEKLARISEEQAQDFLEDIFGDRDIDCVNDDDKEKLKAFVRELEAKWDEEDEE